MKYYIIAGEASGDLHAAHLIAAIRQEDATAQFRGIGGDMMEAEGAELVQHYRHLAYMGFMPVLLHLPEILRGMKNCQKDILRWQPDVVILVDYPGFNLKIARFLRQHTTIPVYYYIAPKIWAWKEHRIKAIKRDIDALFSILPFEVDFFEKKHHYPIHYVGNPTVDEVDAFCKDTPRNEDFAGLPIIALLAGSRKQEVRDNLHRMVEAAKPFANDYQLVLAAAPGLSDEFYNDVADGLNVRIVRNQTYSLLQHSTVALVTSGTATLETALFRVPQVVCYYTKAGRLISLLRRLVLKIPYISLVNLVAGEEVVPELVAHQMNVQNVRHHLASILPGGTAREKQLQGYERMAAILGEPGAPQRAAKQMVKLLKDK
ncbi:MAG: lipid-A-disaccharide synthase [Bacteroidaceae bacterium]|nr:lipid-A-disaccharide synthase [Bacteroidaceae bacterium]